jgi:crossover junction endodeoxyribonuclease RuvC
MPTLIAGLDLALGKSGVATPDGALRTVTPARGLEGYARHWDVAKALLELLAGDGDRPDVVVLEGYAPGSRGILSTIRSAELGGIVRASLYRNGFVFAEVRPNTLKRWATGNGNATKERMVERAVELGARLSSPKADDEADAFLLRAMGRHHYAGEGDGAIDALAVVDWPIIRAPAAASP